MPMRIITAPGIQMNEIDKSQYSPAMTGTACYILGFANKGEAYIPMEFTSRSAWVNYYGTPKTEAERYFYAAACEVLNQNGRLYCAKLPYDNKAFEKIVACKYKVETKKESISELSATIGHDYAELTADDTTIDKCALISTNESAYLCDLAEIDEYRSGEKKPAADYIIIADKTCGTLADIIEDTRKGKQRQLLGIVPVITTAANAMYAQRLIDVENHNVKYYETIGPCFTINDGIQNCISAATVLKDVAGITTENKDLVKQLNTAYKQYDIPINGFEIETVNDIVTNLNKLIAKFVISEEIKDYDDFETIEARLTQITDDDSVKALIAEKQDTYNAVVKLDISDSLDAILKRSTDIRTAATVKEIAQKVRALCVITFNELKPLDNDPTLPDTVSLEANGFFTTINYNADTGTYDRDALKKIGVVVYKTYIDPSEGNKIVYEAVEAFCGSLYKDDKDPNTGASTFIDTIINTNSEYIYFFSNCFNKPDTKKFYIDECDILIANPTDKQAILGFFADQTDKCITVDKSIYDGMNKAFEKNSDVLERDIDIVCDAGLANIASFIQATDSKYYDLEMVDDTDNPIINKWKINGNNSAVKTWKTVEQKFDNFCKNVRKDCMFIADGPRPLVLQGNKKVIRPSKPTNTLDANVIPFIKYVTGLNTNYGAGYIDWFEQADDYSGDFFWCPPSIKAMGVYINTDVNFNYWDAPAGLNRGVIAATDVAFSPTPKQAGCFYEKNWNYAINYPNDGIVLEGQKTFQVKQTALDRVNVRRLALRLERAVFKNLRYFLYEGNTAYLRQRVVDAITPYFKEAKIKGGLYDYKIVCDESNNTPHTIDNNELHVACGIKPVKSVEFIMVSFVFASTGASWDEVMS